MEREFFVFYRSFYESISQLRTPKERYQAYQLICMYGLYHTHPDLDTVKNAPAMLFGMIKPMLDKDYVRAVKRAKLKAMGNGQAGASLETLKLDTRPDEDILEQIAQMEKERTANNTARSGYLLGMDGEI